MVDPTNLKLTLIDFNVSKRYEDEETSQVILMMTNTGDSKYQAPEMLNGIMCHYDERVDIWSAGAILYYLLTGQHAFEHETQIGIENSISSGSFGNNLEY
jgi:serine/threonine protein kinase